VLVYAHRSDSPNHAEYLNWLEAQINSDAAYGLSDLVLSGFLRIVTHPRVFETPSTWAEASGFAEQLRSQPNRVVIAPGPHHWEIFARLCKSAGAKGNLIPDAFFAAMAIENGCEWITTDRDFSRFSELKWRHPLQS
jgi:toxin-antitoxin system PIN domain toxin